MRDFGEKEVLVCFSCNEEKFDELVETFYKTGFVLFYSDFDLMNTHDTPPLTATRLSCKIIKTTNLRGILYENCTPDHNFIRSVQSISCYHIPEIPITVWMPTDKFHDGIRVYTRIMFLYGKEVKKWFLSDQCGIENYAHGLVPSSGKYITNIYTSPMNIHQFSKYPFQYMTIIDKRMVRKEIPGIVTTGMQINPCSRNFEKFSPEFIPDTLFAYNIVKDYIPSLNPKECIYWLFPFDETRYKSRPEVFLSKEPIAYVMEYRPVMFYGDDVRIYDDNCTIGMYMYNEKNQDIE